MKSALKRFGFLSSSLMIQIVFVAALHGPTSTSVYAFAAPGARILETQEAAEELKPGAPIERELAGGNSHSYRVHLTSKQFLRVVVNQKGIDVVLRVFGPEEQKLTEVDVTGGAETVFVVASNSGEYRVEVRPSDKEAKPGIYEIGIAELRDSSPRDLVALAAEKLFEEGNQLRDQRTAESRRNAINKYEKALPLWREAGDSTREAHTLNELGVVYSNLGDSKKAVEYYLSALPLSRSAGDRVIEATTLTNMGTAYWRSGEQEKALEAHKQALPLARAAEDLQVEASILGNTGTVYWALGQPQEALECFQQALLISQARGDRRRQAITLNNIAAIDQQTGNLQKALESHTQIIVLRRAVGDRPGEATSLNNLALLYSQLGDLPKALEYYNQSLEIRRAGGDRQAQATNLQGISLVYLRMGELEAARKYGAEALALARAVADPRLEAYVLDVLGRIHQLSGEPKEALAQFEESLTLRRKVGDRFGETYTLSNIGNSYFELGNPEKALDYYRPSLALSLDMADRLGAASTHYGIARAHNKMDNTAAARAEIEEALAIIESTRTRVPSQDLRSSFLASYQEYFQFYIDLLMRMHGTQPSAGHDAAALQVNERARARSLLEILTEANADIRQGVDVALLERERLSQLQLNLKSASLTRLLSAKHTDEQETVARKEVAGLLADYQEIKAQIRATSPRYAALTQPQPLALKEIQQLLDGDTLLLEYALGEEQSYLWAVTPTSVTSFPLPKRSDIETAARKIYEAVTARNKLIRFEKPENKQARAAQADADYFAGAAVLSEMLLGPVVKRLGRKRLLIVSDGALQYVPFGALPIPDGFTASKNRPGRQPGNYRPLITEHEILSLPSASTLAILRKELVGHQRGAKTVAVMADPVFQDNDPRIRQNSAIIEKQDNSLTRDSAATGRLDSAMERSARDTGDVEFRRLPFSRREAEAIAALTPKAMRKESLDFEANRETATSADLSNYRIIHFATHGLLDSHHPELSGIVLSLVNAAGEPEDGFLRLNEIYNLKLGADLVVLSACRTALGKEIRGEGLVGLTRGFMYAGAPRVVASLWAVDDQITAELMKRFYREMLIRKQRPAAALRAAQVSIWQSRRLPPYYWAAFVLQGEWK